MASTTDTVIYGSIGAEAVPTREAAGVEKMARASSYGELLTTPVGKGAYALANEGSYFVVTNPTPGTAIAGIAAADGLDDTEALFHLRNDDTAGGASRIYLDYLKLTVTAAGTNGTDFAYAFKTDSGSTRYASGGSTLTPVNVNQDSANSDTATCHFGAVVPTAATSAARLVCHDILRTVIKVVGDTYLFDFGADRKSLTNMATAGTAILNAVIPCPPIVLGPQQELFLHEFAASQSVAAQYQFECGYWQR